MTQLRQPSTVSVESVARPGVALGVVVVIACVAQFMTILDEFVVNVALPAMRGGLRLSTTDQQWVVNAYTIAFGGFLLLAARAGDLFGRRRVLQAGLVVFTVASLLGGLAPGAGLLLAARIAQGVGAAALAPASLSLITASHPEGPARARALTVWSAMAGLAAPVGLVLGGVLTAELSWRYVLFVNVPIGVATMVASMLALSPSPRGAERSRLDLPGALSVTAGVGSFVFGVSEAATKGWGSALVLAAMLAGAALLAVFVRIEGRSPAPLVPLRTFRHRSLTVADAIIACVGVALTAQLFFVSLYLQQVLAYSALRTGLAMIPMSLAMIAGTVGAKSLLPRFGARRLLVAGAVLGTAGVAWLSRLPLGSAYALHILGPTLVLGVGFGAMMLPVSEAATAGIGPRQDGLASGLFNVSRQIGGAIGLAVLVTVAGTVTRHAHLADPAAATVRGYRAALLVCAGVTFASAGISLVLPDRAVREEDGRPLGRVQPNHPEPSIPLTE
ncbi:MAG: MFS transporter [Actinomycetota bacterium]|nr:MFS transporter [Actinomycetota bacterium]